MQSFSLKLCVVVSVLGLGCAQALVADDWAHRVCKVVEALPEASASTLASGVTVTVVADPSGVTAVASTSASVLHTLEDRTP